MNEHKGRIGIFIILLLTFLSFIPLRSLKFEFNIEKLFPAGDPAGSPGDVGRSREPAGWISGRRGARAPGRVREADAQPGRGDHLVGGGAAFYRN